MEVVEHKQGESSGNAKVWGFLKLPFRGSSSSHGDGGDSSGNNAAMMGYAGHHHYNQHLQHHYYQGSNSHHVEGGPHLRGSSTTTYVSFVAKALLPTRRRLKLDPSTKLYFPLALYHRPLHYARSFMQLVHPIFDQCFFLDAIHKRRLKEEFDVEPWTFEQQVGEAVLIPAGCPYQIRNPKSCVNVVLHFISPESVGECIHLIDELRQLLEDHEATADGLEVKRMAVSSIS